MKNEYFYNSFDKYLAKYSPKRTKLHHLKKNSRGCMPPKPLANSWPRHANTLLSNNILTLPPPPSEIKS